MAALLIGFARCSTDLQDLTAQRDGLAALGVVDNRIYAGTTPIKGVLVAGANWSGGVESRE